MHELDTHELALVGGAVSFTLPGDPFIYLDPVRPTVTMVPLPDGGCFGPEAY